MKETFLGLLVTGAILCAVIAVAYGVRKIWTRYSNSRKCRRCDPMYLIWGPHGGFKCMQCGWTQRPNASKKHLSQLLILIAAATVLTGCFRRPALQVEPEVRPAEPIFDVPAGPVHSAAGYQLVLDFEVGGGQEYYDKHLAFPTWPGFASGVTVGVGYDLGYNSPDNIHLDWHQLPFDARERLASTSGVTGREAKHLLPEVHDIYVPWWMAEEVFDRVTIGRFWQMTRRAFPGVEALCPEAQWACLSIVFNRGNSMTGARRREMREIREAVARGDYQAIARANRASCRLWAGTDIERGMTRRRIAEAALIEGCKL